MTLSKQLYIIISFIFMLIFIGNFMISVFNTKEYLYSESITKAQDTATSLGFTLKNDLVEKNYSQITTIIKAISNRGFYKEIRVDEQNYNFSKDYLKSILNNYQEFELIDVKVEDKDGTIMKTISEKSLGKQLEILNSDRFNDSDLVEQEETNFTFTPSINFDNKLPLKLILILKNNNNIVNKEVYIHTNKKLAISTRNVKFDYIPQWFINLIPIELPEQKTEVTHMWKIIAKIYVTPNAGDAYEKLYIQVKNALIYNLFAFIISISFLWVFLKFILLPLKRIENLAHKVSVGNFETIENIPYTVEIKNITFAMNQMSKKIEKIINRLHLKLEDLTTQLSNDSLTKLPNKQTFNSDLKEMYLNEIEGNFILIKLTNLGDFAKSNSNENVNELIIGFANVIKETTFSGKKIRVYRFYGSEFAILIENFNQHELETYLQKLKNEISKFAYKLKLNDISHMGISRVNLLKNSVDILKAANEAYEKAKLIGPNEYYINENRTVKSIEDWRILVEDIINKDQIIVKYENEIKNLNNDQLIMKESISSIFDKDNKPVSIGTFISIAEKFNKIIEFDKKIILKVLTKLQQEEDENYQIIVNLSLNSITDLKFVTWLKDLLSKNKRLTKRFIFAFSAYAVNKDLEKFRNFCEEIHLHNVKILVKRYETKFIPLEEIKHINIDYIRLPIEYSENLNIDKNKITFIENIIEFTELLNVNILCDNVNFHDIEVLKNYKIYGASIKN